MDIQHGIPLSQLTTMRLGGIAQTTVTVYTKEELTTTLNHATTSNTPYFIIGGGSNIIARDEGFAGTVIINRIKGFEITEDTADHTVVRIGAGEDWDATVSRLVDLGLSGCEAMSAIPGTAGATPVQNVGAYGQEIADTLIELEAYDTAAQQWVFLSRDDCNFSYRNSIFKDPSSRHHIITSITLRLTKSVMKPPFYESLQHHLDQHNITDYSPASIRKAVIEVRSKKLPDPSKVANCGSFFKNPIVSPDDAQVLAGQYPEMPQYHLADGQIKIPAGWLIEQAKLRGYSAHGFRTSSDNALVVINESATTFAALNAFKGEIVSVVYDKFKVALEQEPETL